MAACLVAPPSPCLFPSTLLHAFVPFQGFRLFPCMQMENLTCRKLIVAFARFPWSGWISDCGASYDVLWVRFKFYGYFESCRITLASVFLGVSAQGLPSAHDCLQMSTLNSIQFIFI